jgi:hypothetical protein
MAASASHRAAVNCPELGAVYLIPIEDVAAKQRATLRVDRPRYNQHANVRLAAAGEPPIRGDPSYCSTARPLWWVRIFRFTRWSALSIVFVSQPSSSAICS